MTIKQIKDKQEWDNFVMSQSFYTFFQSWNWGEFQKKQGQKIWRLGFFDGGEIKGGGFFYKIEAKRGTFLVSPHGPFLDWGNNKEVNFFLQKIKKIASQENCWFVRLGIPEKKSKKTQSLLKNYDLQERPAPTSYSAENLWLLDATPDEETLLGQMRKGHRYSIRKAKREGAKVEKLKNLKNKKLKNQAIEDFYQIYQKTLAREDFTGFSKTYLKNELKSFADDNQCLIFHTKYKGEVIASALIIYYGNYGFYHQGASTRKYKKVPATHILQWEAIKEAKKRGCQYYNFWGIAPPGADKKHPWHGLTFFKQGFGGQRLDLVPARDIKLDWKYNFTRLIEKWQRRKRDL